MKQSQTVRVAYSSVVATIASNRRTLTRRDCHLPFLREGLAKSLSRLVGVEIALHRPVGEAFRLPFYRQNRISREEQAPPLPHIIHFSLFIIHHSLFTFTAVRLQSTLGSRMVILGRDVSVGVIACRFSQLFLFVIFVNHFLTRERYYRLRLERQVAAVLKIRRTVRVFLSELQRKRLRA